VRLVDRCYDSLARWQLWSLVTAQTSLKIEKTPVDRSERVFLISLFLFYLLTYPRPQGVGCPQGTNDDENREWDVSVVWVTKREREEVAVLERGRRWL